MSNETVVTASSTSPGPMPGSRRTDSRKLVRAPWPTITPFGFPVEPDV